MTGKPKMQTMIAAARGGAAALALAAGLMWGGSTPVQADCCPDVHEAVAVIYPTQGNNMCGIVHFKVEGSKIHVIGDVYGLAPSTEHGFHIHEFGDASALDATSAGGHFNPDKCEHAGPTASKHHAGDLGNLKAGADGRAHVDMMLDGVTLCGEHGILGRGVIVHKDADDLKSQPTGKAGARIGVGVIGIANPKPPAPAAAPSKSEVPQVTMPHH
jgi:superoxide dismutase, Cu-Zn family